MAELTPPSSETPHPRLLGARRLRLARKLSFTQVAAAIGVSESSYIKMERGQRPTDSGKLLRLGTFFKVPLTELLNPTAGIPVVGTIGSNGFIVFFVDENIQTELADYPPSYSPRTRALRIGGNAMPMMPGANGWHVCYEDLREPVGVEHIGAFGIIWSPGPPRVRQIERGSGPGLYDLICGDRERDVAVEEFSVVTAFLLKPI